LQAGEEMNKKDPKKIAAAMARKDSLTPKDRSSIARHAALARHNKNMPKAIAEGELKIGELVLSCAVLDDASNTRVLTQNAFLKAIGRHPFAPGGTGSAIDQTAPFLRAKNLFPFISDELVRSSTPIQFLPRNPTSGADGVGYGYGARLLPDVCWVYQDAFAAGKLLPNQIHIGEACRAFLKQLTNYAIEDLVDDATGYADIRKRKALDRIIEKYVREDAQPYAKLFDIEFYRNIYRLNGWDFDPAKSARPGVIGHWTNDIYDRLAPGVKMALHKRVKRNVSGKPTQKLTQYLTKEEGKPEMLRLLEGVIVAMKLSDTWIDFQEKLDRLYPRFGDTIQIPYNDAPRILKKPTLTNGLMRPS
jgi:hypothetical protein